MAKRFDLRKDRNSRGGGAIHSNQNYSLEIIVVEFVCCV